MKTAKVTAVTGVRPYDGKFGRVFYHQIELDNGDKGSVGKKSENAVKVGDVLNYEINGDNIKLIQPQQGNGFKGGQSRGSSASFALAYAKDLMVAAMPLHPEVPVSQWVEVSLSAAKKFQGFLKENE